MYLPLARGWPSFARVPFPYPYSRTDGIIVQYIVSLSYSKANGLVDPTPPHARNDIMVGDGTSRQQVPTWLLLMSL